MRDLNYDITNFTSRSSSGRTFQSHGALTTKAWSLFCLRISGCVQAYTGLKALKSNSQAMQSNKVSRKTLKSPDMLFYVPLKFKTWVVIKGLPSSLSEV